MMRDTGCSLRSSGFMAAKKAKRAKTAALRRKLIGFDEETFQALEVLAGDQMKSWDELVAEALRDLLEKHGRSDDLRTALKLSIKRDDGAGGRKKSRRRD
jgi:hypothetical protein